MFKDLESVEPIEVLDRSLESVEFLWKTLLTMLDTGEKKGGRKKRGQKIVRQYEERRREKRERGR